MTGAREDHVARAGDPLDRGASLAVEGGPGEAAALHRLVASRARIRMAMEAHVRESESPEGLPRGAPRSLAKRLLERARRLPVVRAVLAIRDLRRG
jgi:hypothetical protein